MISLADALKATRRGIHLYGSAWRTAIIADPRYARYVLHDEVIPILEASSLKVELISHATVSVRTGKGGIIRVFGVDDYMDALKLRGLEFTHIIWAHTPRRSTEQCRTDIALTLRSQVIPKDALRTDEVAL